MLWLFKVSKRFLWSVWGSGPGGRARRPNATTGRIGVPSIQVSFTVVVLGLIVLIIVSMAAWVGVEEQGTQPE